MMINRLLIATAVVASIMYFKPADACGGGGKSNPAPTTEKPYHCEDHENCRDFEQCLRGTCTDICEFDLIHHARNAECNTKNHVPYYSCPEGYEGNAHRACSRKCRSNEDCIYTDVCTLGRCLHGCDVIHCKPSQYCRSKNHKPQCYVVTR